MSRLERILDIAILGTIPFAVLTLALGGNWPGTIWAAVALTFYLELRVLRRHKCPGRVTFTIRADTTKFDAEMKRAAKALRHMGRLP